MRPSFFTFYILPLWCLSLFPRLMVAAPVDIDIRQNDQAVELRILPLGASITWGLFSEIGNGYRKPLRDQLRYDGWAVNMVGSQENGPMTDNDVEAKSGDTVVQVQDKAQRSLRYKPNIVLINAGTNDCRLDDDIENVGNRMRSLIESLVGAEDMAETVIVLSTLLPSLDRNTSINTPSVNAQYRDLVTTMREEGTSIILADMNPEEGQPAHGWIAHPDDFGDVTHPNDQGYAKMAYLWYRAIMKANEQGLIKEPALMSADTQATCEKSKGGGISAGGETQRGSGEDDGIYSHSSNAQGIVFSFLTTNVNRTAAEYFFARLWSRERDDLAIWTKEDGKVRYNVIRNTGGNFESLSGYMDVKDNCNPAGVNFVDVNADGLDDFVCIGLDGTAYASINNGDGTSSSHPTFTYMGKWKQNVGYPQARVRLGDVDGDGRADYCVLHDNGDIYCWRNGWIDDMPEYWQALGKRFTGKGFDDFRGVRFEDINGDGRDDWLWVDDDGATHTWTNARSCARGEEGDGLNIVWRQGFHSGQSSGPTHTGMSDFGSSGLRDQVHFARIFGEPQDYGLLGRQDYVFLDINPTNSAGETLQVDLHVWKNTGHGATKIKADGNRYCNMLGHTDGRMDYVWVLSKGDMRLYPNKGLGPDEFSDDGESYWGDNYVIFDPAALSVNMDLDRRDLHLADWDGDGLCDIIWTDPNNNNSIRLWRNRYREVGEFEWEYHATPAPELYCPEERGIGYFDRPVHMADLTGNGKTDYLCVEKDGRSWGFIRDGDDDTWEYIDQIKFAESRDRANLQWADVNGDKKADLVHTNKFNGDGTVWYNRGRKDIGGSQFHWDRVGVKYAGTRAGSCTYYPDLNGDGLADQHSITHSIDNTAITYYNGCKGGKDNQGDDGAITNPNLPTVVLEEGDKAETVHWSPEYPCSESMMDIISLELGYAREMAYAARDHLLKDGYYNTFIAQVVREREGFQSHAEGIYSRVGQMLNGNYAQVMVTCRETKRCQQSKGQYVASMTPTSLTLNFCKQFETTTELAPTKERLGQCDSMTMRQAHRSRSTVLLHEMTHTYEAMNADRAGADISNDYAYGYWACHDLALGTFDRSCAEGYPEENNILCPDEYWEEGICKPEMSALNADSWAFIAAGIYFGGHCQKVIPAEPRTNNPASSADDSCPAYYDNYAFDGGRMGITGYVHFGDSYAAGMGTASTTTDKCRKGSNNYGNLLRDWMDGELLEVRENRACSGDTTTGLNGKITEWLGGRPERTNVATLTIGGNDVNFSDLVQSCVLIPKFWWSKADYRKECEKDIARAKQYISDTSENGLGLQFRTAYERIVNGGNRNLHLYVTGYSGFFNHDTEDCDHTTFYWWNPSYHSSISSSYTYLTRDLRLELNNLVQDLNNLISTSISTTNIQLGSNRIHYVNMQPYFDSHRWCEAGSFHEPDPAGNSWFFLSGWPDTTGGYSEATISDSDNVALNELIAEGSVPVPDPYSCEDELGTDPDPYAEWMCDFAIALTEDPDGSYKQTLERANEALADGDYQSEDIKSILFTTTLKTFHPRTAGMYLFRDAVVDTMRTSGQFPGGVW